MAKAKMTIVETSIPLDRIVRDGGAGSGKIGHTFTMRARLKVSKRKLGRLSGEGIDFPELQWKETIDWFELHNSNSWQYAANRASAENPAVTLSNGATTDLYDRKPDSNTFRNWVKARYFIASDPTQNPPAGLSTAVNAKGEHASTEEKDKLVKHWIAENGFEWTVGVTDVPALGLNPSVRSGGGGGESLVTSNSRRRVIYFDLGFQHGPRTSATQVLEMVNGVPTIHKFFVPGIPRAEANDEAKLALWRTQINETVQTFVP